MLVIEEYQVVPETVAIYFTPIPFCTKLSFCAMLCFTNNTYMIFPIYKFKGRANTKIVWLSLLYFKQFYMFSCLIVSIIFCFSTFFIAYRIVIKIIQKTKNIQIKISFIGNI